MRLRIVAAALAALAAAPALGATVDAKAIAQSTSNADLAQGFKQYDDLDFESALKSFDAALAAQLTPQEAAAAAVYAGIIAQSLGQAEKAKAYFERALGAMPDLDVPEDAPPKTKLAFQEVKARAAAKPSLAPREPTPAAEAAAPAEGEEKPVYKKWWFWAGVGGVVAAVAVVAVVASSSGSSNTCSSPAGTGCVDVAAPAAVWRLP